MISQYFRRGSLQHSPRHSPRHSHPNRPRYRRPVSLMGVFLASTLLLAPPNANAAEATVILSQDCEYLLLDSNQGQVLMKIIKGEKPKPGDTLVGDVKQRDFSELLVKRTKAKISVWVDIIDRSGSKALMRYSQYCK